MQMRRADNERNKARNESGKSICYYYRYILSLPVNAVRGAKPKRCKPKCWQQAMRNWRITYLEQASFQFNMTFHIRIS